MKTLEITNDDIVTFTQGSCHELALAIHAETGWPVFAFIDEDGEANYHAFVQTPDNRYMDIHGVKTGSQMVGDWCHTWNRYGDPNCYIGLVADHREFVENEWDLVLSDPYAIEEMKTRARELAKLLVREWYEHEHHFDVV